MQKATIGGILSIVAGAFGLLGGLILLIVSLFSASLFNDSTTMFGTTTVTDQQFITLLAVSYGAMGVFSLVLGVLGVVGGIFAIQRKRWGWALAGAISGCITFMPVGIASVVLIAMGKPEFGAPAPATPPPPPQINDPI